MEKLTIRIVSLANGEPHAAVGKYVISYDPEYHLPSGQYDGGKLELTEDVQQAGRFTQEEAFRLWRSGPTCSCHRTRWDGEANKPLTSFNVVIE